MRVSSNHARKAKLRAPNISAVCTPSNESNLGLTSRSKKSVTALVGNTLL